MQTNLFEPQELVRFTPRVYQQSAHDQAFRRRDAVFYKTDELSVSISPARVIPPSRIPGSTPDAAGSYSSRRRAKSGMPKPTLGGFIH